MSAMGRISGWRQCEGWGFLTPDAGGTDVLFYRAALVAGSSPRVGRRVRYEMPISKTGKIDQVRACRVEIVR